MGVTAVTQRRCQPSLPSQSAVHPTWQEAPRTESRGAWTRPAILQGAGEGHTTCNVTSPLAGVTSTVTWETHGHFNGSSDGSLSPRGQQGLPLHSAPL